MPASELLINVEPAETRVALVEDGIITELHLDRPANRSIVGSVPSGRVSRVLRGMQAAFVDIGLDRHAFLQIADTVRPEGLDGVSFQETVADGAAPSTSRRVSKHTPISQVVKGGQELIVQVSRAPMGKKGARVTSHISLVGRHLVYMPTLDRIGISRRIQDEAERRRLRAIVEELQPRRGSHRTHGGGGSRRGGPGRGPEILKRLWNDILSNRAAETAPSLLYGDLDLALRAARDLLGSSIGRLVVDDSETYERLQFFVAKFSPDQAEKLALYAGEEPIFDAFGIEEEVQRALARVIPLPSGGSLVIDHAEALTAIDVNTGRIPGGKDLEETIIVRTSRPSRSSPTSSASATSAA